MSYELAPPEITIFPPRMEPWNVGEIQYTQIAKMISQPDYSVHEATAYSNVHLAYQIDRGLYYQVCWATQEDRQFINVLIQAITVCNGVQFAHFDKTFHSVDDLRALLKERRIDPDHGWIPLQEGVEF